MMKKIYCGKEIWPDEDARKVNDFLKKYNIKLDFLLSDGICFSYPDEVEANLVSSDSCYFIDSRTKVIILHYYESFGELVLENDHDKYSIPILEDL